MKNNLQTVAALLRLQARRIPSQEGRAALEEAMRRVATIALVHETLSEGLGDTVVFDDVLDRCLALAVEVADGGGAAGADRAVPAPSGRWRARTPPRSRSSSPSWSPTPSSTGWRGGAGTVARHRRTRRGTSCVATVADDGRGLPREVRAGRRRARHADRAGAGGGRAAGRIGWTSPPEGGTLVTVDVDPARQRGVRSRRRAAADGRDMSRRTEGACRQPLSPSDGVRKADAGRGAGSVRALRRGLSLRGGPERCGASARGARPRTARPRRRRPARCPEPSAGRCP